MSKELFGTDGIRGTPGEYPLDDRTLYWAGRVLGAYLKRQSSLQDSPKSAAPRVLMGMDTRESGPHIAGQIAAGLAEEGVAIASAGVISTPGVACLVRKEQFSAGVVISASHNPYHDNGVKLFAGSGMKFPDEIEEQLEAEILRHQDGVPPGTAKQLEADRKLDEDYLEFLRGCVLPGANLAGMKIVLDCANGAASSLGPALFASLGADGHGDSRPARRPQHQHHCGSLHPEDLQKRWCRNARRWAWPLTATPTAPCS